MKDSRSAIGEAQTQFLRVGATRKEEVLLRLGEPDATDGCSGRYGFINSTRRSLARPSSVRLAATGRSCPSPVALKGLASIPSWTTASRPDFARASESVPFDEDVPTLSV